MRTKAERRCESEKALKRGREIAKSWHVTDPKAVDHIAHRRRDTPAACSCGMCCNKRRRQSYTKGEQKLTMQERRQLDAARSANQVKEADAT